MRSIFWARKKRPGSGALRDASRVSGSRHLYRFNELPTCFSDCSLKRAEARAPLKFPADADAEGGGNILAAVIVERDLDEAFGVRKHILAQGDLERAARFGSEAAVDEVVTETGERTELEIVIRERLV